MTPSDQLTGLKPPPALDVQRHALFLDLDGTLVEIAAHPEQVVASEELRALLSKLAHAMNGAVALITGRTIASADAVLNGALVHVAGIHGYERRNGSDTSRPSSDMTPIASALEDARTLVSNGALDVDIEDKGAALALHYRRTPQFADAVRRVAAELAQRHGLSLLEGKMVIELKIGERTKAHAIRDFMATAPFAGRTPVAVGDDITDEDAFRAVRQAGGVGVLVGDRADSAADYRLANTKAVMRWLEAAVRA